MGVYAKQQEPDIRYQRILHHATTEFSREGYEDANLEVIANKAGVGKPTIYGFFRNKADLFEAVIEARFVSICQALDLSIDDGPDVEAALLAYAEGFLKVLYGSRASQPTPHSICKLVIAASFDKPEIGSRYLAKYEAEVHPEVERYFSRLVARGVIPPVRVEAMTVFFFEAVLASYEGFFKPDYQPAPDAMGDVLRVRLRAFLYGGAAYVVAPKDVDAYLRAVTSLVASQV